jgi:FimV-like protein
VLFKKLHFIIIFALLTAASSVTAKMNDALEKSQATNIHTVGSDETLLRIAINNAIDSVPVWQYLISIYQLNPDAFIQNDISRLRPGSRLLLPKASQITSLSADAAVIEYHHLFTQGEVSHFAKRTAVMEQIAKTTDNAPTQGIPSSLEESPEKVKKKTRLVATQELDKSVPLAESPAPRPFILNKVTFTGNESFSSEILHAVITDAVGNAQNFEQLEGLVARITQFYQEQGYSIARAILPAQTISQGNLTIHVIEAKYGRVHLTNNSGVNHDLLVSTAASMKPGMVISNASMYRTLLLLSDVPGLVLSSTLSPGYKVGSSDVTLIFEDGKAYSASLSLDQYGDAYTGKERIIASAKVNNLASHGDVLSVNGMSSGENMQFGRLAYDRLLSGDGTHLGVAYSGLNYYLGKGIENAKANGTTRLASMWVDHPFLRGLDTNFSMQLQYDVNQLKDHVDSVLLRTDRTISSLSLTSTGNQKSARGRGGISSWSLGLKVGVLSFDNSSAKSVDSGSTKTIGEFKKFNININHLQRLSSISSIYFEATAQWASGNLDPSEKLVAGGVNAVRGYNSGSLSGDMGYVGSVEVRYYLNQVFDGGLTGSLFYDAANIIVNKTPWDGLVSGNSSAISSVGVGLDWIGPKQASASFAFAVPMESKSALVVNHPSHTIRLKVKQEF